MQKIFWFFFSLLFLFCGVFTFADLAGYTITNYQVDMQLYENGSMDVTETIDVHFSEARHGIYRTIPFYSPSGRYTIIEKLRANGDTASSFTEGNTYQLKIGDANRTISWPHTYHINYTVKNAIAGFGTGNDAWTELYWNLIGTEWATTIDRVNFKLHLPKETAFSSGAYYVVYGKGGEKKTENSQISLVGGSELVGSVKTRLWAYEGMTIGVKFPADYFSLNEEYFAIKSPLSSPIIVWNQSGDFFAELFMACLVLGGFIVVVIFVVFFRERTYTSNKPVTIYYTPPKEVDLSLAGIVYDVSTARIFTALIYRRITQGYLTLEIQKGSLWNFWKDIVVFHKTHKFRADTYLQELFTLLVRHKVSDMSYNQFEKAERKMYRNPAKSSYFEVQTKKLWFLSTKYEVPNEQGKRLYEQIRGFAYYLAHVEKPRLEYELKNNPHYVDDILPRAVLFGVETKFLKAVEEVIQQPYQPERYSGYDSFSLAVVSSIYSGIKSAATPPTDSGSGWGWSSGFSGWGGSSGGWGGGGWGGSW